jgi:hypothetical protein
MKQFEISRKAPTSDSSSPSVLVQPFRIETWLPKLRRKFFLYLFSGWEREPSKINYKNEMKKWLWCSLDTPPPTPRSTRKTNLNGFFKTDDGWGGQAETCSNFLCRFFIRKQTKILLFVEKCFQFQGRDQ